jgi:hypothetical protein
VHFEGELGCRVAVTDKRLQPNDKWFIGVAIALQPVKGIRYADKYQALGQPIHLIGVAFSKASRNIVGFEVETIQKA